MSYFCKRFQFGLAVERRCKDMKRNRKAQPKAGLIRLKAISKPLRENRRRMEDGRESVAWTGGVKNAESGEKVRPSEKMHLLFGSSAALVLHALRLSHESILGREQGIWKSGLSRLPAKEVGSQGLAGSNPAIPARQPDGCCRQGERSLSVCYGRMAEGKAHHLDG